MKKQVVGILKLIWVAFRRMPLLVLAWFTMPVIIGFTILPGANAQVRLIDLAAKGSVERSMSDILSLVLAPAAVFAVSSAVKALAQSIKNVLDKELTERYMYDIQSDIIDCTMNAPMECFEDTGFHDRLNRARNASKDNLLGIFNRLSEIIQILIDFAFIMVVLSRGHWLIPVFAAAVSAVTLIQRLWIEVKVQSLNRDLTFEGRMADNLKEGIVKPNVIKEMRIFGTIDYILGKWTDIAAKQNNARGEMRRMENKTGAIFTVVRPVTLIISVYLLMRGLQQGNVTPGIVAVVFQRIIDAQLLSVRISIPLSKIYLLGTKALYIVEFLSSCKYEQKHATLSPSSKASLSLKNLSFSYPGADRPSVIDTSFSIKQGETIALVGENGSGKSTLVNLLIGLYTPTAGKLYWDGQDYAVIRQDELREKVSVAFQDFMRYELSIRENIGIGNPAGMYDDENMKGLLSRCGISDIADGNRGLDRPLGRVLEGGRELSGGQWQRLAIARAMFRDAELIIFDEPTAALDPNAEMDLFRNFQRLTEGKTAIFVSHRLGWARFADRILVMDQGRLVEMGTHDELMRKQGKYAESFAVQASWYM